jgi:acyl-CoA synthetase (AMP-forming)/AMP-acid ligase II
MSANYAQQVWSMLDQVGDRRRYTFVRETSNGVAEEHLTYREIGERARQNAGWLACRLPFGSRVVLMYPAGLDFLPAFLGCLFAGMVAVPTPVPHDRASLERVAGILVDSGARLVLTDGRNLDAVSALLAGDERLRPLDCVATGDSAFGDAGRWRMPKELTGDTVAFLQYTSGSTSEPRGVVITHANLAGNQRETAVITGLAADSVTVSWLPHHHDMGLMGAQLYPLNVGTQCVLMSPTHFLKRPRHWLEAITRHRGTITMAPNFAYELCLRRIPPGQLAGLDLSTLRRAFNGAEPVRARTMADFAHRFGPVGFPDDAFGVGYGLAEATLGVTGVRPGSAQSLYEVEPQALEEHRVVPAAPGAGIVIAGCGHPVEAQVRIVEPDTRAVLPDGEVGEIWVSGPGVAKGYWGLPQVSRDTFEAVTAAGDGPFLRTGDLGFLRAGELCVTGRRKDLIIIQGRNLYPQDIERVAAAAYPGLRGRTGAAFSVGAGSEHIVIVQETTAIRPGGASARDIALAVRQAVVAAFDVSLPSVSLVRSGIPRTTSGKVRRQRAREMFLDDEFPAIHHELAAPVRRVLEQRAAR